MKVEELDYDQKQELKEYYRNMYYQKNAMGWTFIGVILLFALIIGGMYGCPRYSVWQQGMAGQSELKRAEQNRQIAIQEAMAKEESAKHLANAEIARARGVDSANRIISNGLKGNIEYLHYLWIDALKEHNGATIYVPTEAGIPIMEAMRFKEGYNEVITEREKRK